MPSLKGAKKKKVQDKRPTKKQAYTEVAADIALIADALTAAHHAIGKLKNNSLT